MNKCIYEIVCLILFIFISYQVNKINMLLYVVFVLFFLVLIILSERMLSRNYGNETNIELVDKSNEKNIELDRIYYINLDRRPDRNQHFLRQCEKAHVNMDLIERFRAVDGTTLQTTPEIETMFQNSNFKNKKNCKKLMGNQLSHYRILQDMIRKNYKYILILQDDVVFKNNFNHYLQKVLNSLPSDAEIVNVGLHKSNYYSYFRPLDLTEGKENLLHCKRYITSAVCELRNHVNPCSLAYIVTRRGAINLVDFFQKNGFHRETDHNYNDYLREKNINYGSKVVLCTGALMGSDIFD